MKATLVVAVLLITIVVAWMGEPAALAAGLTKTRVASIAAPEPAWMQLSGVSLIALGSIVRRFTP
jgi:hypothetical protein